MEEKKRMQNGINPLGKSLAASHEVKYILTIWQRQYDRASQLN